MILHLALLGVLTQAAAPAEPVRIVREIQVAVDRDGGQSLERTWRARLARSPREPGALLAAATFERARYRYERADSLYRLLDASADRNGSAWSAMAQVGMAGWRALGSEPMRADSLYAAALISARAARATTVEAEAVLGLAQLRQRTQGPRAGQALLAQWWGLLEHPSAADSAQRLCLTGALDEQLGDTTGASRIRTGASAAERLKAWRLAGSCRLALAQTAERRGYLQGARSTARLALEDFARIRYRLGTALASQWFGYVQVQASAFAEARTLLEQAIVAARETRFESVEAWAHSGLAELRSGAGRRRSGSARRPHWPRHRHAARGDRWGVAVSRNFEASALSAAGELPAASGRYLEAQAAFVAAGLPLNALPSLSARAALQLRLGQLDSAEKTIETAASLGRTTEGWKMEQLVLRAGLAMRRGQFVLADSLLRSTRGSREWRNGNYGLSAILVATREAQLALRRDRLATADSALEALTNALDQWRRRPLNAGITSSLAQLRNNWGGLSDAYPDLVIQLAAHGRSASAFELIEHIRAREIVERSLRSAAVLRDTSAAARALRPERDAAPVVTIAELQRALAGDEAFVSYALGLDEVPSSAVIVTRDAVVSRALPSRSALAGDIQRFSQLAAAGTEAAGASRRLGAGLLAPVFAAVPGGITRVILSLDGDLHRVPFDALRLPDGRYAVERASISFAPSATALLALRTRGSVTGTQLVAFGDPAYPARAAGSGERAATLVRLPYSGDEARRVGRYGQRSTVHLGRDASDEVLRTSDWSRVGVLHVAAHALVDAESQSRTALALSPGASSDGFVLPGELSLLELRGPLVVLSACSSSGGQILGGEGLRGLTAPLLEAGARAVVATHWAIGDRSVVPFIDRFYAAMATGARVDDALRAAKLAAIRDSVSIADWGSYSVVGDGAMRVSLRQPRLTPVAWHRGASGARRSAIAPR